ncbi:short-chain dehydrogenase/reductase family 16C member 6-like [Marmota marmota marmota]|uniref:short-chain dehydrogenase/reductase family 16C member 6-like n=1 Tax=Marmota marmota marmota TaxID=9994 RepID=UPI0020934778|nr:short-chain dehydrogenase/reductase family 16C member 6-like [Marmota marmota marmota]
MSTMVDTAIFLGKFLYYFLESVAFKIIPRKKKDVAGEIVLITGAGSGLGRLLALHFARTGAILVLWDINQESNMETCRLAKEKGGVKVFAYKCDCSNRQEVYSVADQVKKEVGDVTILINNAGIVTGKPFLDIPDHMMERSFYVNAISHFWICKAFFPAMLQANHGHLVCISSIAGMVGTSGLSDHHNTENKQRYQFLLPLLEQEYVAQKIFNAILEEQVYLLIPKFAYFAVVLKHLISPKMMIVLGEYLGADTCMDSFKGRMEANKPQEEVERKCQ